MIIDLSIIIKIVHYLNPILKHYTKDFQKQQRRHF